MTAEWEEGENWQEPGPMLTVADGTAFVVDSENQTLAMVDIASGEVYNELELPVVPHEIQVTTGTPSGEYEIAPGAGEEHGHEGHDHEGEEHEHAEEGEHDHEAEEGHEGHDH